MESEKFIHIPKSWPEVVVKWPFLFIGIFSPIANLRICLYFTCFDHSIRHSLQNQCPQPELGLDGNFFEVNFPRQIAQHSESSSPEDKNQLIRGLLQVSFTKTACGVVWPNLYIPSTYYKKLKWILHLFVFGPIGLSG